MFLPLKQCIEILGANLQPRSAQAILDQCLQGIMQKVLMHWAVHTCQPSRLSCTVKTKDKLACMQAIFVTIWLDVACMLVERSEDILRYVASLIFPIPDHFDDILHVSHDQAKVCPQKGRCWNVRCNSCGWMQEDWQMRRQAVETFITLAAAVQVSARHSCPAALYIHIVFCFLTCMREFQTTLDTPVLQPCNDRTTNCTKHVLSTSKCPHHPGYCVFSGLLATASHYILSFQIDIVLASGLKTCSVVQWLARS